MKQFSLTLILGMLLFSGFSASAENWDYQHSPEKVTNLKLNFPNGSLTGSVSFTLPTETVGKDDLTGSVEYAIVVNNTDTVARGSGKPAEDIVVNNITLTRGYPNVTVYSGYQGKWADFYEYAAGYFIGYDSPKAVTDLTLSYNAAAKSAHIAWTGVTAGDKAGEHSGYINADSVKYLIYQYAGTDTLALDTTAANSFDVDLSTYNIESVAFGVMPINGMYAGPTTATDEYYFNVLSVPYEQTFATSDDFATMSIVSKNSSSSYTWSRNYSGYAQYNSVGWGTNNCWLVTPAIQLDADKMYQFSYDYAAAASYYGSANQILGVAYGQGSDPTTFDYLVQSQTIKNTNFETASKIIRVEKSGAYKFGFQAKSASSGYTKIDNIKVTVIASTEGPAAPKVSATPADKGALEATVTFTVPSVTGKGETLTKVDKAYIYRDGERIDTLESGLTIGSEVSYTDTKATNGLHYYSVNLEANGQGGLLGNSDTIRIGEDVPANVQNVRLSFNGDGETLDLKWDKISNVGANGGYVNADAVSYNVVNSYTSVVASNVSATSYNISNFGYYISSLNQDEQATLYYMVYAQNGAGQSPTMTRSNTIIVGKPYSLPYKESFAGGKLGDNFEWNEASNGKVGYSSSKASDGDKGSLTWTAQSAGDLAIYHMPKIALNRAKDVKLLFTYYAQPGKKMKLTTYVDAAETSYDKLQEIDFSTLDGDEGWRTVAIPLDRYNILSWVAPYITMQSEEENESNFYIDDVNVREMPALDIAISQFSADKSVYAGDSVNISFVVSNEGQQDFDSYSVNVYANGKQFASQDVEEGIKSLDKKSFNFTYPVSASAPDTIKFYATVSAEGDLKASNNTTDTLATSVEKHDFPKVEITENNGTISWNAPQTAGSGSVTETFESYANNSDVFGSWKNIDGDGANSQTIYATYPNKGEAAAFTVWNPVANGQNVEDTWSGFMYKPHGGLQYALSFAAANTTTDNWLISPKLYGGSQTITFYARRGSRWDTEKYEVLYSTTGNETNDFTSLKQTELKGTNTDWAEESVELPDGATYFAIHHISESSSADALLIDDITYKGADLEVKGYRIYKDSVLFAEIDANATSYSVPENGKYQVTVVYDQGESELSNAVGATTGITTIQQNVNNKIVAVYDLTGKRISSVKHGVNIVRFADGSVRKVVVK